MSNCEMDDEIETVSHLLVLYVVTSGLQGDSLGTDQKEITWLSYTLIDVRENAVVGRQQYVIKPSYMEKDYFFDDDEKPADGCISKAALAHAPTLTDQVIRENGISLEDAVVKSYDWLSSNYRTLNVCTALQLVVDGQAPIRHCLYPEALKKFRGLGWQYERYFDIRKEFSACYSKHQELQMSGIKQMMEHINLPPNRQLPDGCYVGEAADMVSLVQRMIADGHTFRYNSWAFYLRLDTTRPADYSRNVQINDDCVARIRGLGWPLETEEVREFFTGLNILSFKIAVRMSGRDKHLGEAVVCFESKEQRDLALQRHNHFFGQLRVEVYKASINEYKEALATDQFFVRMTGLPSNCTAEEIVQFFDSGEKPCKVLDGKEGVSLIIEPPKLFTVHTNSALVAFPDDEAAQKALSKHESCLGENTVTISRIRASSALTYRIKSTIPLISPTPKMGTSMTSKNWIHLQYPCDASVNDILECFGEYMLSNIARNGIHVLYARKTDEPIGELFVKMNREDQAADFVRARCRWNIDDNLGQVVAKQCNFPQVQRRLMVTNIAAYYMGFIEPRIEQCFGAQLTTPWPDDKYEKTNWIYLDNIAGEASVEEVLQYLGKSVCQKIVTNTIYTVEASDDVTTRGVFIKMINDFGVNTCKRKCMTDLMEYNNLRYLIDPIPCGSKFVKKRIMDLGDLGLKLKLGHGTTMWDEELPIRI